MSVIRIKKTENFVVLHKRALEDPRLSFKAKGLWAYCLSRPNDWTFHVTHLATVSKEGTDAIYSAIKELIECGYARKIQEVKGGKFQKVDYEIFETCQIQEILPLRDFPYTEDPQTENPPLLSIDPIPSIEEENKSRPSASPPSQAQEITLLLLGAIKKTKPDLKEPNLKVWQRELEKLLRIDKRLLSTIKEVLEWLPTSTFWSNVVLSADKFRAQFDKLELAMRQKPHQTSSEDIQLLKKLSERKDLIDRGIIIVGPDYVEFPQIRDAYFRVGEPGFKEKVLNSLRKCGIPIN